MPVDKFGHTDSGFLQRVIAGGVTLTQVNNTFVRRDGTNAFTGNLDIGGNSIEGLSTTYTPSEDNHLTNKKYVDRRVASNAIRDYVAGMKVSPGNRVRNPTSGIIYRFEGIAGPITAAPALSSNWRPTTGVVVCVLRDSVGQQIRVTGGSRGVPLQTFTIVINTDSAYTTNNRGITIPRTGVYRLGGYVTSTNIEDTTPAGSYVHARYNRLTSRQNVDLTGAWTNTSGVLSGTSGMLSHQTTILPSPTLSLVAGDQLGMVIETNASCSTAAFGRDLSSGGSELQVEFLY